MYVQQRPYLFLVKPPLDITQEEIAVAEDGSAKKESHVAPNLSNEASPVAHDVFLLVSEHVVLEPEVDHPLGLPVSIGQPGLAAEVLISELWSKRYVL